MPPIDKNNIFFKLLRLGLRTGYEHDYDLRIAAKSDEIRKFWLGLYSKGKSQGVDAILLDGLNTCIESGRISELQLPPQDLKKKWLAGCLRLERFCDMQYKLARELAELYSAHGIRTAVLKGIALGICYPVPNHRPCGDFDCFLMGDYELGNKVAEDAGSVVKRDTYKHSHINYKGLEVENHQYCTEIRGGNYKKRFERLLQSLLIGHPLTMIRDTCLGVPSSLFNAVFLIQHSQHHYLSEGIALRHLCDWAMFLKVYGTLVDWRNFDSIAKEYGLKVMADAMTVLADGYLNVKIPDGYDAVRNQVLENMLLNDIMRYQKNHAGAKGIRGRIQKMKAMFEYRDRYRLFSDTSMLAELLGKAYGICFEKEPRL